jgi:hypothetical protein
MLITSQQTQFTIIESQNYPNIETEMSEWNRYALKVVAAYAHAIGEAEDYSKMSAEQDHFSLSSGLTKLVTRFAQAIQFANNKDFYLCYTKERLQGVMVIKRAPRWEVIDLITQPVLQIMVLITHPTNIRSTITAHPDQEKIVRGAGSALLQYAEELALGKNMGIYVEAADPALPFYRLHHYRSLQEDPCHLFKTRSQIASEVAERALGQERVA